MTCVLRIYNIIIEKSMQKKLDKEDFSATTCKGKAEFITI